MKQFIFLLASLLLLSCQSQPGKGTEAEYIVQLEEKNDSLEKELKELRGEKESEDGVKPGNSGSFFTIGSSTEEVIAVMGQPTSYIVTAPEARRLEYGLSTVYMYQDKVISFENLEDNLKVKVK